MNRRSGRFVAAILAAGWMGAWAWAGGPAQTAPASVRALQVTYYFIPG